MKRAMAVLAVIAVLTVPAAALAFGAQQADLVTVPKGETRAGTYFAAGQTITVDGNVDGDLVCAANNVVINGSVSGDVICAAQTITVNGPVGGNVRVAGQLVNLNGTVGRNAMVATQSFNLGGAGSIGGDLGLLGQMASVGGSVTRDLYGAMEGLTLAGSAKIGGDLKYSSNNTFNVDRSLVAGKVERTAPPQTKGISEDDAARAELGLRLYWMIASLLVGLAFVALAPKLVQRVTKEMRDQSGKAIGWGLIVTLLGPVLAVMLAVTVLGIPLALLVTAAWLLLVTTSGIFAGIAAGEWFVERAEWSRQPLLMATAVGVPLSVIVFSIPVLGWLVGLVATWWAVGGVTLAARKLRD